MEVFSLKVLLGGSRLSSASPRSTTSKNFNVLKMFSKFCQVSDFSSKTLSMLEVLSKSTTKWTLNLLFGVCFRFL